MKAEIMPLVSIVVPSYNQGRYIDDTIRSILKQDYPNVEVLVMDGGSVDGTLEKLRRFGERIIVFSEPDRGQTDAISKGFNRARGSIVAWLNSDDVYLYTHTISHIVELFRRNESTDVFYGDYIRIDEDNTFLKAYHAWKSYDFDRLTRICYISQPTVFFRKETVEKCPLDDSLHYVMDLDLWLKFGRAGYSIRHSGCFVAAERIHGNAKTVANPKKSLEEGSAIVHKYIASDRHADVLRTNLSDKLWFALFRCKALLAVLSFWMRRDTVIPLRYRNVFQLILQQFVRA